MSRVSKALHQRVIVRARNKCEYCRLAQDGQEAVFHVDHVIPVSKGGPTTIANLALACVGCSLHKSARRVAIDPMSKELTRLFNPRTQDWFDHFRVVAGRIVGKTATGRATISALRLNRPVLLAIRSEQII